MPEPPAPMITTSNLRLEMDWVMRNRKKGKDCGGAHQSRQRTWMDQPAQPTSQAMVNTCSDKRSDTGLM